MEVGDDSAVFGGDVGVDFTSVDEAVTVDVEERERERDESESETRLVETREFDDALDEAQLAVAVGVQAFQEALGVGVAVDAEEEQEVAAVDGAARAGNRVLKRRSEGHQRGEAGHLAVHELFLGGELVDVLARHAFGEPRVHLRGVGRACARKPPKHRVERKAEVVTVRAREGAGET